MTRDDERGSGEHIEPLFAALGPKKRAGSMRWKVAWVVIALVALALLVWKQAY